MTANDWVIFAPLLANEVMYGALEFTLQVVGTHGWVADTLRLGGVSDYLTQPGAWEETSPS